MYKDSDNLLNSERLVGDHKPAGPGQAIVSAGRVPEVADGRYMCSSMIPTPNPASLAG